MATRLRTNLQVLYLLTSVIEGLGWLVIAFQPPLPLQLAALLIGGMAESAATVVFLTAVQRRLKPESVSVYYGWLLPSNDAFIFVGTVLAGLIAAGSVARLPELALIIASTAAIPPLLLFRTFLSPMFRKASYRPDVPA